MAASMANNLLSARGMRVLLLKWLVALIVPVFVFTFVWQGDAIVNNVLLGFLSPSTSALSTGQLVEATIFLVIFYAGVLALGGYLFAADTGRRGMIEVWLDVLIFAVVPILIISSINNLVIGLAISGIIWPMYLLLRSHIRIPGLTLQPLTAATLPVLNLNREQKAVLVRKARVGGLWLGAALAVVWLVTELIYYLVAGLPTAILIWAALRTLILPVLGYFLGWCGGLVAVFLALPKGKMTGRASVILFWVGVIVSIVFLILDLVSYFSSSLRVSPLALLIAEILRTIVVLAIAYAVGKMVDGIILLARTVAAENTGGTSTNENGKPLSKTQQLALLSDTRKREEIKDLVPNDLPLRSTGAQRFYLILLVAFVLFYPVLDPFLFGSGTSGRLAGYGDAGYYVILALGLNVVVGFAGLLDLGYVAFFAIGAYTWGIVGSTQLGLILGTHFDPQSLSWLFWPMLLVTALVASLWGVVLGAPTLRLRGDYLAIVTLGFGEIVPVVFLNLDKYTNGTNGLVGIHSPAFFGVDWSVITPAPYYYLILALIALTIFANIRLRDSRLGRAWIAIREDEIAAASSGINLVNTKLFAFGTGAFFSGIAGAYHSAKLGGVSPDTFSFGDSVIYLAMVVIGGIGSIPGVIVGALVVYAVNLFILAQFDTIVTDPTNGLYPILHPLYTAITFFVPSFTFGNIRNLIFGIILVVVMIFRPEGLIPSARRRRELHHTAQADEPVEITTLDVPPGAPDFESEVHVE